MLDEKQVEQVQDICDLFGVSLQRRYGTNSDGDHTITILCPKFDGEPSTPFEPVIDYMIDKGFEVVKWEKQNPQSLIGYNYEYEYDNGSYLPERRVPRETMSFKILKSTGRLAPNRQSKIEKWNDVGWKDCGVAWMVRIIIKAAPREVEMAPPEILAKIKEVMSNRDWRENRSVRRVCDNKRYTPGQRVYLYSRNGKPSKFTYWFITSYRTRSDMGAFLLYRSDGRVCSHANAMSDTPIKKG